MSGLLISEEEFFEKSNECKDAIRAILGAVNRNGSLGINDRLSEVAAVLECSYGLFYNAILKAARIMCSDWNAIEVCITNMTIYDNYLSDLINNNSQAANYDSIGCGTLWSNMHVYDVDLEGSEFNESALPSYNSADSWIITYGNIERIDDMRSQLDGFTDVCDDYLALLEEYESSGCVEGLLGDAINRYLANVHVRLLECIKSVAREFTDAMNQYCISYFAEFPETGYYISKRELVCDISSLDSIACRYDIAVNNARNTITSATRDINVPGLLRSAYNPVPISYSHPGQLVTRISQARDTIQSVIDLIDELEANGRALSGNSMEDITGLKASIDHIEPLGGFRIMHYHSDGVSDILDVPNVDDVTDIEVQDAVYNTEAEYFLSAVRDADPADLPDAIEATRVYLSTLLPEGLELSDELILNISEYYYSLIEEGWTPDQALAIVLYSITDYSDLLAEGDYDGLNESAATTCPDPCVVTSNAVAFAMRIANDGDRGYDQQGRDLGDEYDCSSLVMHAYIQAGVPGLQDGANGTHSYTTVTMQTYFESPQSLFECVGSSSDGMSIDDLQPGDILLCNGHTEIYVGNGYSVSARSNLGDYDSSIEGANNYNYGYSGDSGHDVPDDTVADLNDPSTLDQSGEIRFENDINSNGQLHCAHTPPWQVYRYTGVPQGDV
ncbi:hypothetical protein SAMN06296952_1085 [Oscillospiraceae bacterium]|nr:hypothetical protein SAMN06296952_1085 [Oscillospiraceae bacterium]